LFTLTAGWIADVSPLMTAVSLGKQGFDLSTDKFLHSYVIANVSI
jgi:hypothetical protein